MSAGKIMYWKIWWWWFDKYIPAIYKVKVIEERGGVNAVKPIEKIFEPEHYKTNLLGKRKIKNKIDLFRSNNQIADDEELFDNLLDLKKNVIVSNFKEEQ